MLPVSYAVPQRIAVLRKSVVMKLRNTEGSSNFATVWSTEQTPHFCIAGVWEACKTVMESVAIVSSGEEQSKSSQRKRMCCPVRNPPPLFSNACDIYPRTEDCKWPWLSRTPHELEYLLPPGTFLISGSALGCPLDGGLGQKKCYNCYRCYNHHTLRLPWYLSTS